MHKKLFSFFLVVIFIFIFSISSFALSSNTSAGIVPSNSTCQNLITQAMSYDNFYHSDYVVFRASTYLYYIVWGDNFAFSNGRITADNIEYISYNRYSSGDNIYYYEYRYGTDTTFSLVVDETVVTNIQINGFSHLSDSVDAYNFRRYQYYFFIFGIGILFVIMLSNLKGGRV